MAKKEFFYKGKAVEELKKLNMAEFGKLTTSRARRSLKRGFTNQQQTVLKKLRLNKPVQTHCRDMLIVPEMLDKIIKVHDGRNFVPVAILPEMLGHALGEFVLTRKRVRHSAPGIGATKSSASLSVK
jgi:small subunit ribosomal protein S19